MRKNAFPREIADQILKDLLGNTDKFSDVSCQFGSSPRFEYHFSTKQATYSDAIALCVEPVKQIANVSKLLVFC